MTAFIDALGQLAALVEKYGISTIFLIGLIIGLTVTLKPKVDAIWAEYSNARIQKATINVNTILNIDLQIKGLLTEILLTLDCDFAQLWQFHNGIFSLGLPHLPFLFASITHEVTSKLVTAMSVVYRSIPTTLFGDAGDKFLTSDFIITTETSEGIEASRTFAIGAATYVILPINNREGKLAALLALGWRKYHKISTEEEMSMKNTARRIGILLADALLNAGASVQ